MGTLRVLNFVTANHTPKCGSDVYRGIVSGILSSRVLHIMRYVYVCTYTGPVLIFRGYLFFGNAQRERAARRPDR